MGEPDVVSLLTIAANRLASIRYSEATLDDIASDAGLAVDDVLQVFPSMHMIGARILDHERLSMKRAQRNAFAEAEDPLTRLVLAFRAVGENLANDIIVRAGVRIASESREFFPERRLDPFKTWEGFATTQMTDALASGALPADVDVSKAVRTIVTKGMEAKDLLAARDAWDEAPELFERTVTDVLASLASK